MSSTNWNYNPWRRVFVCGDCNDREFVSQTALFQHLRRSSNHNWCQACDLDFYYHDDLEEHLYDSPNHHYCRFCKIDFDDDYDLDEHNYNRHAECDGCHEWFETEGQSDRHAEVRHWYCKTHKRCFDSESNLRMHMNSSAHVQPGVICPAGCGRRFVSHSGAVIHLESGSCASGMTREEVNYLVARWDRQGLITTGRRALPAPPSSSQSFSRSTQPQLYATEASYSYYDGAYKCYLDNKLFGTLRALNQHLSSGAHAYMTNDGGEKLYRCPHRRGCGREFTSLSGLVSHIERASCGVRELPGVRQTIDSVMGGMKRLTL
ncbi:hypothetical protein JCM5350_004211 [Sporobolomyces pararoseus]